MKFRQILGLTIIGAMLVPNMIASAEYNPNKLVEGPITTLSVDAIKKPMNSFGGLVVNGKEFNHQETRVHMKENGTVMIPLRNVSEALGYTVKWNEAEKNVELTKGPHWITVKLEEDYYTFGKMAPMKLGTPSEVSEGKTYVPVNLVTDILKAEAIVDETGVVTINEKTLAIKESEIEGRVSTIVNTGKNIMVGVEGTRIGEGYDSIILNISENTEVINPLTNEKLSVEDLKQGDTVRGFYGPAVTASIPPQGIAERIEVLRDVTVKTGTITDIINDGKTAQILIGDRMNGIVLNINDETKIISDQNKDLTFKDLQIGMQVEAFHGLATTMSLPPISLAKKIVVKEATL